MHAKGHAGADDRRCRYVETAPVSLEGWQAWDVAAKCAGQLRLAPVGGVAEERIQLEWKKLGAH
jgi:hypothetical protein